MCNPRQLLRTAFGISAAVFLSYVVWIFATSSSFQECIGKQTATETSASETKTPPNFLARIAIKSRCSVHVIYEYREAVAAIGTVFIALFTCTLWVVAYWARRDTKILQRAYLGVKPGGIHHMRDKSIIAYVTFVNSGNLPARNVRNEVKIKWFDDDGNRSDFGNIQITDEASVLLLPKIEIERGTEALSEKEAAGYRAKQGFIYVWGRLEYDDGIGTERRWLIFCHRYNCRKPDVWRQHHHHNDGN